MPYLNLDPNYFDHPKTKRLVGLLGPMADVLPIRLWSYCARVHAKDGAMRGYTASEIESVIRWSGAPNKAVRAMTEVGYIVKSKRGYACKDWHQHQGHLEAFSRRGKIAAAAKWKAYAKGMPNALHKSKSSNAPTNHTNHTNHTNTTGGGSESSKSSKDPALESALLALPWRFGAHAGKRVAELPPAYCPWALANLANLTDDERAGLEIMVRHEAEKNAPTPRCRCGETGAVPVVLSRDGKSNVCANCRSREDAAAETGPLETGGVKR